MTKKKHADLEMVLYYERFISKSRRNKRTQTGGKRISKGTLNNYSYTLNLLKEFESFKSKKIIIYPFKRNNKRLFASEKRKWLKFYRDFTDYLFDVKECYDNYVGLQIKNIKIFFNWLRDEKGIFTGDFHKHFHVWKEEIPILVLHPAQLDFLINNDEFHASLPRHLRQTKDFFVFGCTVALRVSDLLLLRKTNIEFSNGSSYLNTISKKTQVATRIKLPDYALEILERNKTRGKFLFAQTTVAHLNRQIKELMRAAEWNQIHIKTRQRRGKLVEVYKDKTRREHYRFCDLITTHTMRRTAITTMLRLGMNENIVRKISGHSPGSVEFYKYVKLSQQLMDDQMDMVFQNFQKTRNVNAIAT